MELRPRNIEEWPQATSLERNDLMIVFHGLLSLCYNDAQRHCEVAAYAKSKKHKLKVAVAGASCSLPVASELSTTIPHSLELVGGSGDGPRFYMPEPFCRTSDPEPDENDFRWLLDIEGRDFYDQVVSGKKAAFYRPQLLVKAGTFYTLERTCNKFSKVNLVTGVRFQLGRIAYYTAVNVRIESGQEAKLVLNKHSGAVECRFPYGQGPYTIFFWNTCEEASGEKCKSNDFFHHFASFPTPTGRDPLAIEVDEPLIHTCSHRFEDSVARGLMKSNDEAPCGAAGYGGTPGMPPP